MGSLPYDLHQAVRSELSLPEAPVVFSDDPLMARLGLADLEDDILERLGADTRWAPFEPPPTIVSERGGTLSLVDEWGAGYRRGAADPFFRHAFAPLEKATGHSDLKNHPWPKLDGSYDDRWGLAAERAAQRGSYALCLHLKGVLEVAQDLRGAARVQAELAGGSQFLGAVLDRVAEAQLMAYGRLVTVLGGSLDAVVLTCDGLAAEHRLSVFSTSPGRLFPAQALVLECLSSLGLGPVAVFGRGEEFLPAAHDLGADALIASGGSGPGGHKLWWTGPESFNEIEPEEAWRAAALWARELPPVRLILAPWLSAAKEGSTAVGAVAAALALGRARRGGM
jgi:hypothetical protein